MLAYLEAGFTNRTGHLIMTCESEGGMTTSELIGALAAVGADPTVVLPLLCRWLESAATELRSQGHYDEGDLIGRLAAQLDTAQWRARLQAEE